MCLEHEVNLVPAQVNPVTEKPEPWDGMSPTICTADGDLYMCPQPGCKTRRWFD
jgi:hypothetical protein